MSDYEIYKNLTESFLDNDELFNLSEKQYDKILRRITEDMLEDSELNDQIYNHIKEYINKELDRLHEEELDYEEKWEDNSEEYRLRDFEDKVDYYYDYLKEKPQLEWADKQ